MEAKMNKIGNRVKIVFNKDNVKSRSKTHQSFAKEADINNIMSKYKKTGVLVDPLLINSTRMPRFGDFSDLKDYSVVFNRIQEAQSDFMTLPASTRAKFNNNVEECLAFIADPNNKKDCIKLQLIPKPADEVYANPPVPEGSEPPKP